MRGTERERERERERIEAECAQREVVVVDLGAVVGKG